MCPVGPQLILDVFKDAYSPFLMLANILYIHIYIYVYEAHVPPSARSHGCDSDVPVLQFPGKQETIMIGSPGSWKTGNEAPPERVPV